MSKYVDISENLNYDGIRTYVRIVNHEGGKQIMTENKMELIRIIFENDNPEQAILTAAAIIGDLLTQHELLEEQIFVDLQASGRTSQAL